MSYVPDPGHAKGYQSAGWALRKAKELRSAGLEANVLPIAFDRWGIYVTSEGWLADLTPRRPDTKDRDPDGKSLADQAARILGYLERYEENRDHTGLLSKACLEVARLQVRVFDAMIETLGSNRK